MIFRLLENKGAKEFLNIAGISKVQEHFDFSPYRFSAKAIHID